MVAWTYAVRHPTAYSACTIKSKTTISMILVISLITFLNFCRYVATSADDHRYHLPRQLQEFKVLSSAARKPLVLLALLEELAGQSILIFTSSLDTTHK